MSSADKYAPTHKVSNNICMAHDQRVRVLLLFGRCPMEILPEASLDTCSVLEELLQFNPFASNEPKSKTKQNDNKNLLKPKLVKHTNMRLWVPMADWRLRCNWRTLFDQCTIFDRHVGNDGRYDFARFLGSRHCRTNHFVERQLQHFQPVTGLCGLFAADFRQISIGIGDAVQIVLAMPDEYQMPDGRWFDRF